MKKIRIVLKDPMYREAWQNFLIANQRYGAWLSLIAYDSNEVMATSDPLLTDVESLFRRTKVSHKWLLCETPRLENNELQKYRRLDEIAGYCIQAIGQDQAHFKHHEGVKLLAVTSLLGGAGKTILTRHMAKALSNHGKVGVLPLGWRPVKQGQMDMSDHYFEHVVLKNQLEINQVFSAADTLYGVATFPTFKLFEDRFSVDWQAWYMYVLNTCQEAGFDYLIIDAAPLFEPLTYEWCKVAHHCFMVHDACRKEGYGPLNGLLETCLKHMGQKSLIPLLNRFDEASPPEGWTTLPLDQTVTDDGFEDLEINTYGQFHQRTISLLQRNGLI